MTAFRGSRLHILDWVESAGFRSDLKDVAQPFGFEISDNALVLPLGHSDPREARLESFLPHPYEPELGRNLKRWWVSTGRGNTPNWDLAARATVGGRPALVLMEAKANVPELSHTGKPPHDTGNKDSQANYNSIASALSSAQTGLSATYSSIQLDPTTHYQLANRLAFSWKLASLGVPVLLVYLGFLGDGGLRQPLRTHADWAGLVDSHLEPRIPRAILDNRTDCGRAWFTVAVRSRRVLRDSPPPPPRAAV